MNTWSDFVLALGQDEDDSEILNLCRKIEELAVVSETPNCYNDPQGKTTYYKYINSGLELGFRVGKLNHIHFFVQPHEGYSAYKNEVLGQAAPTWRIQDIIVKLGPPLQQAPHKVDMLIGEIQQWLRYEINDYAARMEFARDGTLWKATLMLNPYI